VAGKVGVISCRHAHLLSAHEAWHGESTWLGQAKPWEDRLGIYSLSRLANCFLGKQRRSVLRLTARVGVSLPMRALPAPLVGRILARSPQPWLLCGSHERRISSLIMFFSLSLLPHAPIIMHTGAPFHTQEEAAT
jgi:hypothetical protein